MEHTIAQGNPFDSENPMHLDYTIDVMNIMTKLRNDWGLKYPEEE